jgi:hypothetical protein
MSYMINHKDKSLWNFNGNHFIGSKGIIVARVPSVTALKSTLIPYIHNDKSIF